ncbi:unnamed protein product [Caenorhabditis bovis]|uniref:DOMON domain-containing protein n=1 Tax=Caenorhabditis bovis TaxID=2654633 RepID=A0A8S1ER21_9PELO|nr:unnamed protein product [Caenorhabditis bovis]
MLLRASILVLFALAATINAHVKLVYPVARAPALDYYSSANSDGACGVKKPAVGQGVRTYFKAGSTIELEWFIGVPHMGGIRLEVLNSMDEPIAIFTNFNDPFNVTETTKKVELPPNFECNDCAIRMTSQATEYGNSYFFFSCADINIVNKIPDGNTCLNHGNRVNGVCQCLEGYYGDDCQHLDECKEDDDCGVQGYCKRTGDSPRYQCFCPVSRFGKNCEEESDTIRSVSDFDESLYEKREDQGNKIYWRIIKDEIEFVLRYPTQSWVALGWKAPGQTCELTAEEFTIPEVIRNATHREQFDAGEKECGPNEKWSECPESSRECEHSCDWTHFPETTPNCPNACGTPRCICNEGFVRMANDEDACVPFDFCDKTVEDESSCPSNSTWAKCGTACEPTCANMYDTAPCPASCEKPACTCADNYVRHNGECIYWGDCPEIADRTTSAKVETTTASSTIEKNDINTSPIVEHTTIKTTVTECALNETLNECGRVCEPDCVSIFTRTDCTDCGSAACACIQGYARNSKGQCVYWGDCSPEEQKATTTTKAPEVTQKPVAPPPSVNGDVCYGDFRYPAGCSDCEYKLSWNYLEETEEIEFSLETRLGENSWTGVGFSEDGTMNDADMIIVTSRNGKLRVNDMTSRGYDQPALDAQQDVKPSGDVIGSHSNGVLRAQFIRKVNTGDSTDKQFDKCWKMLYPLAGGKLDQYGNVSIHLSTPVSSEKPVCIRSCSKSAAKPSQKAPASCINEYRFPEGCTGNDCDYIAKWNYDSTTKDVRFEITSKTNGRWTGIGFSKDGQMTNADVYTGWVYDEKAYITDRFAYGRQLPAIDPADRQDIYDIGGKSEDDSQTIWFRRKLIPKDSITDLPLNKCQYFLFPVGGGRVLAKKSSDFTNPKTPIGYHDQVQPQISATKICLCDEAGVKVSQELPARVKRSVAKRATSGMHCADMVVGMVSSGRARVVDMYSPSKATPMMDEFFGGKNSLTSAAAFQEDAVTTVIFRKKLQSSEKWDNSFVPGPMTVIWAHGADPMNYVHTTGGAPIQADKEFFSKSFKYHGKNQRGIMTIDFFENVQKTVHGMHLDMDTCTGSIEFPEGCKESECAYKVTWISDGQVARFTVKSKVESNQWTALGFSTDGNMAAADAVVIGVQNNAITVTDQFMPNYGRPVVDEQQDIFDVETAYINGILTANFSRELHSDDEFDVDLQECVYLLYTPSGGVIEKNGEIRKHQESPLKSHTKICLNKCTEAPGTTTTSNAVVTSTTKSTTSEAVTTTSTTTTTETPMVEKKDKKVLMPPMITKKPFTVYDPEVDVKKRYGLRVRILNRDFTKELMDPKSEYYQLFTKDVTKAINNLLAKRWKGMQVSKIIGYEKGSVIAEFEVVATDDVAKSMELKSLVEETAIRGPVDGFSIEPSTVKASEIDDSLEPSEEDKLNDWPMWRNIAIIALCSVFMLIFVSLICCLLCRCRRSSTYSAYPVADAHMSYGARMLGEKSGFDNAMYHQPTRYYSQSVASTKLSGSDGGQPENAPGGVGETTYQEWYSKVGSKPASQQHEEAPIAPAVQSRPPSTTPYVSYPNDPTGYYTLGGKNRATGPVPPSNKYQKY